MRRITYASRSFWVTDQMTTVWDRFEAGTWEPTTLEILAEHVDQTTVVFDIGSWMGPVALYVAASAQRVICIEADPIAAARLRGNLPANPDLIGKIEVIERAFASKGGKVRLGVKRKPGDSMSSVLWTQSEIGWSVDAITPAELAPMAHGASKVFLKIDIEGSEYEVLPHIGPLLTFPEVTALISFHPQFVAGGGSEWTPELARLTARVLQPFSAFRSFAVTDRAITSVPMASVLDEAGGTYLPVRDRWLFINP